MNFNTEKIVSICAGKLLGSKKNTAYDICFFCTDSRTVRHASQSIFVPIITEARDGHYFIAAAFDAGIRNFLVSDKNFSPQLFSDATFILVNDTLQAMQQIAAAHRAQFDIPVIGITGSNGKTIVKEWLAQLVSHKENIVKNPKSYNSQMGVPISVSAMDAKSTLGIFEAGISKPHEMANLEKIIQPTIGIFTMIGEAHDANFLSTAQKIDEKLNLFTNCKKLYYCKNHTEIDDAVHTKLTGGKASYITRTWGESKQADLQISTTTRAEVGTTITALYKDETLELTVPYNDAAHIENAIHCWLVLLDMGYAQSEIAPLFLQLPPIQMRLELMKGIQNCTIINDTYSSDLASLQIALDYLKEQKQHPKRSLILSDIVDHGNHSGMYDRIFMLLKEQPLHRVILIGESMADQVSFFQKNLLSEVLHFQSADDFLKNIDISIFKDEAILVKGARQFVLERIVNRLEENIHRTVLYINLSALVHNANFFKRQLKPGTKIMAMVKAFSYGSSTYEVASALEHYGVDYLAVAYVDEGILLRKKGIRLPILVLNPELSSLDAMLHYDLEPEIYSLNLLKQFAQRLSLATEKFPIHIKLDTGMHRLGVEEKELEEFITFLKTAACFVVKSTFSHLVASDNEALADFTTEQLNQFLRMSHLLEKKLGYPITKHISNSGGAIKNSALQLDMVRLGIGLYGIDSRPEIQRNLQQISTLKTTISQIKKLSKTETVGYGRRGILDQDSVIATLNIGYADGYSRAFSQGKGKVLIHGKLAPVVGNVCMDMIMVDVTNISETSEGDEAIILGPELSVTKLAEWIDTIPYEIISGISQRVKRIFYRE